MSGNQIYSAKYSGVDVYEFIHPTGSVMKRKNDDWVNATHILKAAKFAKAKRTRILEKEVIKEVHEKVQGGFGKYQGTWVPLNIARRLAEKFDVHEELGPLFDFTRNDGSASPPQAPKHHHASRTDSTRKKAMKSASTSAMTDANKSNSSTPTNLTSGIDIANSAVPRKRGRPATGVKGKRKLGGTLRRSQSELAYPRPSIPNSSIATTQLPSIKTGNLDSLGEDFDSEDFSVKQKGRFQELEIDDGLSSDIEQQVQGHLTNDQQSDLNNITYQNNKKIGQHGSIQSSNSSPSITSSPSELSEANPFDQRFGSAGTSPIISTIPRYSLQSRPQSSDIHDKVNSYLSKLVDYFISSEVRSNKSVPTELLLPPPQSAPYIDAPIDPELHTAFHWACAMGNLPIAEALVRAGTNIRSTNSQGQTALMRSSMFHNSYSARTFPKIFDFLRDTVFDVDSEMQTVLHHIVKRKSSTPSTVYYLDTVLSKLKDFSPQYRIELLLNSQDQNGDTATHIAAKNGDKVFFNTLINNGALSTITNRERVTASEIMNEQYEPIFTRNQSQMNSNGNFLLNSNNNNSNNHNSNNINGIGKPGSPNNGSMTPLTTTTGMSEYIMFASQAATRISRYIPEMISSLRQCSEGYNELYLKRENEIKMLEKTLHDMSKTIQSVKIRTMETLQVENTDDCNNKIKHENEETNKLKQQVCADKIALMKLLQKRQWLNLNHLMKEEETEHDNFKNDTTNSLEERLKFVIELSLLQIGQKSKLDRIIQTTEDNTKVHKYRKMISEGTEINPEEVDECLDIILESLTK